MTPLGRGRSVRHPGERDADRPLRWPVISARDRPRPRGVAPVIPPDPIQSKPLGADHGVSQVKQPGHGDDGGQVQHDQDSSTPTPRCRTNLSNPRVRAGRNKRPARRTGQTWSNQERRWQARSSFSSIGAKAAGESQSKADAGASKPPAPVDFKGCPERRGRLVVHDPDRSGAGHEVTSRRSIDFPSVGSRNVKFVPCPS